MNIEEQTQHFEKFVAQQKELFFLKGSDYSNEDRLSNFKLAGNIIGQTPRMVALTMISLKLSRLGVLLNSENPPNNESIRDSLIDMANYTILLDQILSEEVIKYIDR